MASSTGLFSRRTRKRLFIAGLVLLGLWLLFFDSHSLVKRYTWHQELDQLRQENKVLEQRINELDRTLEEGLSAEDVERIAREEYGMRRPGETVYRLEEPTP